MKRVLGADLGYPIILASDGAIMDGVHRICKALLQDQETILSVQFSEDPKPDEIRVIK